MFEYQNKKMHNKMQPIDTIRGAPYFDRKENEG